MNPTCIQELPRIQKGRRGNAIAWGYGGTSTPCYFQRGYDDQGSNRDPGDGSGNAASRIDAMLQDGSDPRR